jgi:hypothetical protein
MNLPNQSKPVSRNKIVNESKPNQVQPSGIACTLCMAGCSALSGIAKTLCQAACNATVC